MSKISPKKSKDCNHEMIDAGLARFFQTVPEDLLRKLGLYFTLPAGIDTPLELARMLCYQDNLSTFPSDPDLLGAALARGAKLTSMGDNWARPFVLSPPIVPAATATSSKATSDINPNIIKNKPGRKVDPNRRKWENRMYNAHVKSGTSYSELAKAENMPVREIMRAVDNARKREDRKE